MHDGRKNIRSWLTGINDINNCSIQAGDNLADAFSMRMTYQLRGQTTSNTFDLIDNNLQLSFMEHIKK